MSPARGPHKIGLSEVTLSAVRAESVRAEAKHGFENTLINPNLPGMLKMAALGEEFGEIMEMLTYDKMPIGLDPNHISGGADDSDEMLDWANKFVKECIQLSNLAAAWAESVDEGGN